MNKQQLASKIWQSANEMRSKIEANEYKDYILGFIFYKFLSDKELKFMYDNETKEEELQELLTENNTDLIEYCQQHLGYYISYNNLFSTWLKMGADFKVKNVSDAISAFNRLISKPKLYNNIFNTLETGLSKLGDNEGAQTKAVNALIDLIKDIPMDNKQDYDVLGFIYEYLISNFAANAGKKAGEFYTPYEVSLLMSEIVAYHLREKDEIEIYDPTSGSGSLLINIGQCVLKHMNNKDAVKYYAQEVKENTYNLTRMNLIMRGIKPDNIFARRGDTLEEDWPMFDDSDPVGTYKPLYLDAVVSNPPYSQKWSSKDKENDPRYLYGLAPESKADYAFLLHDLYHLKPEGIMTIVLPHGVLFRGDSMGGVDGKGENEGKIRRNLVEHGHIEAVIGLPANIFFGTGIPTIIMVLKQKRTENNILFIDASKEFVKSGNKNILQARHIKKIVDTYKNKASIAKYSRLVDIEEIRENGYNLNIPRYINSSDEVESYDIYATIFGSIPNEEIESLKKYWNEFPELKNKLFKKENNQYLSLVNNNIKDIILNDNHVSQFINNFNQSFADFGSYLRNILIEQLETLNIANTEDLISENIYNRINNFKLLDYYDAYQYFIDEWQTISSDLEVIQTEGFQAVKQVDPNIVRKKKNNKEVDVQEGYIGHIIPFELIQKELLQDEYNNIISMQERSDEIKEEIAELIDSLPEDERESQVVNNDNTAFVAKELEKKVKEICFNILNQTKAKNSLEKQVKEILDNENLDIESVEYKFLKAYSILDENKKIKKDLEKYKEELHNNTKDLIENLDDNKAKEMLYKKWIEPVITSINLMPGLEIETFINKIMYLSEKYKDTLVDISNEITVAEKEICSMIDELDANEFDLAGLHEFKKLLGGN